MSTTKKEEQILNEIRDKYKEKIVDSKVVRDRRVSFVVKKNDHIAVMKTLLEKFGFNHCSTVTGYDAGTHYEAIYHLFDHASIMCNVTVQVPKEDPALESATPMLPSANLYEREVFDLIGLKYANHPNLKRLVLPEEYPADLHPLRKETKIEDIVSSARK